MNIAVFGATGIVGKAIVNEALQRGHRVTILTRRASKVTESHPRLTIIEGDVTDRHTVGRVIDGQQAVIQTLGIGGKGNGRTTTLVSDANRLIIDEMEARHIHRLIAISVIGAGDSIHFLPWAYRKIVMPLCMRWFQPIIDDKNRMEAMIMQSRLDWTIVRCTTVKDRPARGRVRASLDGKGLTYSISAADMATFFADLLQGNQMIRQTPTISN